MTDMFQPETSNLFASAVIPLINKALVEKRASQPKRQYLGASMWGDPCDRKLAYQFHQTPIDEGRGFSPEILRVFDMGHDCEDRVAEYVKLAGFDLVTHKQDGSQFGFSAADGKLKGHIDGVIIMGPQIPGLEYPVLWENKGLNDKSWNDTVKKGVKVSKPLYYAQAQTYMAYMDLPKGCMFTILNRNTGEMHAELIKFDARAAQVASDRAVRVIATASPLEMARCTNDSADLRCKFCDFRIRCWGLDVETNITTAEQLPSWLKRKQ